jgi:hypothetical protein
MYRRTQHRTFGRPHYKYSFEDGGVIPSEEAPEPVREEAPEPITPKSIPKPVTRMKKEIKKEEPKKEEPKKEEPKKEEPKKEEPKKEEPKKEEPKKEERKDTYDITGFPSLTQKLYDKIKMGKVTAMRVCREPVNPKIQKFLNTLSLGIISKVQKKSGYDNLYHLWTIITVDGKSYRLEKNATISLKPSNDSSKDCKVIDIDKKDLTFGDLMTKTKNLMGSKFFPYDGLRNNCQDFINSILVSNRIGTAEDRNFVKQDVSQIIKETPGYVSKVMNKITDIGGAIDKFVQSKLGFRLPGMEEGGRIGELPKEIQGADRRLLNDLVSIYKEGGVVDCKCKTKNCGCE